MLQSILLGVVGPSQVLIIVLVILLLFGGKKIPELMRGIGKGVKEFKDGLNGVDENEPRKKEKEEQ
ncbi:MAG: twin-arginine translocase TatA/TatE family subunit [Bacteroidales bacterium]|nr:twin-arginine translocase TatA/TatE family subunit [Bacteroidales bacterium]